MEDFAKIHTAQRMVVASGMFEDENVIRILNEARVKIHKGYLENVEEVYQMADAYLFPTRSAEFVISIPLSVMEALSCGVPVGIECEPIRVDDYIGKKMTSFHAPDGLPLELHE